MLVINDRRHSAKLKNEMDAHPIPVMTDPMGKHWEQPARAHILVDKEFAVMSFASFKALHTYSASNPSGVYPGKMWKRFNGVYDRAFIAAGGKPNWLLCWYGTCDDPKFCSNHHRKILLSDADINLIGTREELP